jgi:diguanylate cyclase (GGDEF)-like protein/PAS domain S-box-containing protein
MPLSLDRYTETENHERVSSLKRLGAFAGFVFLLALLVANTIILRHQLSLQVGHQNLVNHTRQILFELERTQSLLKDAESGQLGFLYTGDPVYLNPYSLAITQVRPQIDDLAQLTADDPRQQESIAALHTLTQVKLEELGRSISLFAGGRPGEAKLLTKSHASLVAMNSVSNLISQMEQEATVQEASRMAALEVSTRVTILTIYLAGLLKALVLVVLAYYILREINHRQEYLREIWKREEWYRVTIDSIGDAVICADTLGNVTLLNPVAEKLTGWPLPEAIGLPVDRVFQIVDATTRRVIANPMVKAVRQDRTAHLPANCILIGRDGTEVFIADSAAPIHGREGKNTGSVLVFRDVSAARALAEKLTHSAQHDSLTGLPNRSLLNDRVGQAIALARRQKNAVAILFLDLDGFKHINDSLGHLMGDKLLQSIAKRLLGCVRAVDTVSRQGGDEFVVLLQEVTRPENASDTAARLLDAVAAVHCIDERQIYVTGSIGVSLYPGDGKDAETLYKNADTAMYLAKRNGRQNCQFYVPDINAHAEERYSIEQGLRCALERHELTLNYQPRIDLKSGALTGAEALLRWTHPTLGTVSPEQFIPIAEESGLILPIGAWVLHEACKQASAWADAGLPLTTISVNVSAVEFRDADFLDGLFASFGETGLDPQSLELEMTESVLMKNPELTTTILRKLRKMGVRVSVDDFGTGYSSLSYLQQFPLDALKIDQSFVRRIDETPNNTTIVSAIIRMGQSLHLRVIAEGVETIEDLEFLRSQDCDEAQGYYFGHPVPAAQFARMAKVQECSNLGAPFAASGPMSEVSADKLNC